VLCKILPLPHTAKNEVWIVMCQSAAGWAVTYQDEADSGPLRLDSAHR
jgi:hypothetical protein